jgi:hypothetical protein
VPVQAVRGGAETMYPEYERQLEKMPMPPLPHNAAAASNAGTWVDMVGDRHPVKANQ